MWSYCSSYTNREKYNRTKYWNRSHLLQTMTIQPEGYVSSSPSRIELSTLSIFLFLDVGESIWVDQNNLHSIKSSKRDCKCLFISMTCFVILVAQIRFSMQVSTFICMAAGVCFFCPNSKTQNECIVKN